MALIALNDAAPDEAVHFSLANSEISLEPGVETETDNAEIVREAKVHPWIDVIDGQIGDPEAAEVAEEPVPVDPPLRFADETDTDVPAEEPALDETPDFTFDAGQEN